jgi:muramidase (phage lysozyme)
MNLNRKAFLDMIAVSEGTYGRGENGYNVICGGGLFYGYDDHPRRLITLQPGLRSTAAGRYQLLSRYFDAYKESLHLPDFSPASQDAIAIQQIRECKALDDVDAGRFGEAIRKCARIWASLPGAGYGQHENSLGYLQAAYERAGGTYEMYVA